jgi:hemoglobin-like flavoprotein
MFRSDRAMQAKMLAGAIAAVLDHLDDAPWLQQTLGQLGARHTGYGVTDAMYGMVGEALLATLAEIAAEAWTPVVETLVEARLRRDHDDDAGRRAPARGVNEQSRA